MSYLDFAKHQVRGVVNTVIDMRGRPTTEQTVTVAAPLERIEQFWRDPQQMSVVLGDIADVEMTGEDRYRWRLREGPQIVWDSKLIPAPEGVRFVGTEDRTQLVIGYRAAPRDLGTEVTLRVTTPLPGMLSGAAAYTVLYRLRALLQTGEVPTIRINPSARKSAR